MGATTTEVGDRVAKLVSESVEVTA
jgi:hypothetical protein